MKFGLEKFKDVIAIEDFIFIQDNKNIETVLNILNGYYFSKNIDINLRLLEEYTSKLKSFYNTISENNIEDINNGYSKMTETLKICINILKGPFEKIKAVSSGYLNEFKKEFTNGIKILSRGLKNFFIVDGGISLGDTCFVKYLLDEVIGLGNKYEFNKNVIKDISSHNFGEGFKKQFYKNLIQRNSVRSAGLNSSWEKYGDENGDKYRAYGSKGGLFSKTRIYFLIRNTPNEKTRTDAFIGQYHPSNVRFEAA